MRPIVQAGVAGVLLLSAACFAQSPAAQPSIWAKKPDVAVFEKTENAYLATVQQDINQLTAVKGARTVANTLEPYDDAVRNLDSASDFAGLMQQVHPDKAFRHEAEDMTRKVSAAATALALNQDVYHALSTLDVSKANPTTKYYVHRTLLEFRLAGVDKDQATRDKLKKLNDQLTELQTRFDRNISDDERSVKGDPKELDGLPADYIARHKPGPDGKVTIKTDYPDYFPVMKFAKSTDLRRRLYIAFLNRAYPANQQVLMDMIRTRDEIANLLGYKYWADYNAADKMIGNGQHIAEFIDQLKQASTPIVEREFKMLLAEKRKTDPKATTLEPYEMSYYSELVRRADYDFDSASVRPYLPYQEVKQGILETAQKLFSLKFKQEVGAPAWAPTVETWDVYDHGKMIGRFYLDMHPRPGKYSHAEMVPVRDGILGKQIPEAALVCNFAVPTATDPGLMEFGDVETFFHEFGHLMHMILGGQQPWAGISGITMESDFVEAPSQMLENWMHNPVVLSAFAKNYKTGKTIPPDLVSKMDRALAFGRGLWVASQTSYTALSYDVYSRNPNKLNFDAINASTIERFTPFKEVPGTHMWASFGHLGGYSSAYYTYLWDKVIAQDFYAQFNQKDPMLGTAPEKYRDVVLKPGGSEPANELVKNFLGRAQNTKAFQAWMSQEFTQGTSESAAAK